MCIFQPSHASSYISFVLVCYIDFPFDIIGPYDIVFCIYQKRFSFFHEVSPSLEIDSFKKLILGIDLRKRYSRYIFAILL